MRRNPFLRVLTAALALGLAACSHHAPAGVAAQAEAGGTHVVLAIDPAIVGEANVVTITLTPSGAGRPLDGAVTLDLDMPDMAMAPQHVPLARAAGGSSTAGGVRFAMGGRWRAVVRCAGTPGALATLTFDVRDD
jgi:hypothetical protein